MKYTNLSKDRKITSIYEKYCEVIILCDWSLFKTDFSEVKSFIPLSRFVSGVATEDECLNICKLENEDEDVGVVCNW